MPISGWFRRRLSQARAWIRWIRASEAHKRQVAVHEAGHALAAWLLPTFGEVTLATVMPEGDFRGYTLATHALSDPPLRSEIEHLMTMGMAGAAAEKLLLGRADAGSADDMIHTLGWWLVYRYGMPRPAALGVAAALVLRMLSTDPVERYLAHLYALPPLAHASGRALELLAARREDLMAVANRLRRRRRLRHRDLERLLGPRPA